MMSKREITLIMYGSTTHANRKTLDAFQPGLGMHILQSYGLKNIQGEITYNWPYHITVLRITNCVFHIYLVTACVL